MVRAPDSYTLRRYLGVGGSNPSRAIFAMKKNLKTNLKVSEKITKKEKIGKGVIEDKDVFADYKHECKKCGHRGAEVVDLGVQYSDEDNLFLVKCGKCGHTERIGEAV